MQAHLDCCAALSALLRDLLAERRDTQPDDYGMSLVDFERIDDAVRFCVEQEKREELADAVQTLANLRADLEELDALPDGLDEIEACKTLDQAQATAAALTAAAADI